MSDNLFEEYVNGLDTENPIGGFGLRDVKIEPCDGGEIIDAWNGELNVDPEYLERIRETLPNYPAPTPIWTRVCSDCGVWFPSMDWRAERCPDCGGGK